MTDDKRVIDARLSVTAQCPYCGSDRFDMSVADEVSVEPVEQFWVLNPEERASRHSERDEDHPELLLWGCCSECEREFGLNVQGWWPVEPEPFQVKITFHMNGLPRLLHVGRRFLREIIVVGYRPQVSTDPLLGLPPFGTYEVWLKVPRGGHGERTTPSVHGTLEISSGLRLPEELGGHSDASPTDSLSCWFRTRDPSFKKTLAHESKSSSQDNPLAPLLPRSMDLLSSQAMDGLTLARAGYIIVTRTEMTLRILIWRHLAETSQDDPSWWMSGGLPNNVVEDLRRTAERSGDRSFAKYPPEDYLTLGHLREIVRERWNSFKDYLPGRDRVLFLLQRLEDVRNPIMHLRPITAEMYRDLRRTSGEVEALFRPFDKNRSG